MTTTVLSACPIPQKTVEARKTVILAVSPAGEEQRALDLILEGSEWQTLKCGTCAQARRLLRYASVVLCERELPDGDWKQVLKEIQNMLDPPLLVVTSRLADERLWAEVLNLGGYDVLAKPFKAAEVLWTVAAAHRLSGGLAPCKKEGELPAQR